MSHLEIWVVYNSSTGQLYIIKSKRSAVRLASTFNKLYKLLNNNEKAICECADDFFKTHHIDKNKIIYCWDIPFMEKINLQKRFFKQKVNYE